MKYTINPQLKEEISALLSKSKIELWIGGEPTFVVKNPDTAEWKTAAMGPEKYGYALKLSKLLNRKVPKGSVFYQPIGKTYPGESAARWNINLIYRKDGKPIWKGNEYLAEFSGELPKPGSDKKFLIQLANSLGIEPESILPAYLNPEFFNVWMKKKNDWITSGPDEKSFSKPAGFVLPLSKQTGKWISQSWKFLGKDKLYLINAPGQLGLRLPLNALPPETPITALTAEIRDGKLCIFIPPLQVFQEFLDMLEMIENAARKLNVKCISVEGYPSPFSEEVLILGITPDPGVVEVNLPPSFDQNDYEKWTHDLFECAEKTELRAFKWQYTGEKVGTGGGSHITLGGPNPDKSPFFLVPHLLPSFIRFFQNHPSLSYLFSGQFVGPTSQAPRVDEGRLDFLYELEIALKWGESVSTPINKWFFQNMFKNMLTDLTGNTHRSEITIDKLANPDMGTGALGLVEFRAFEMPEDARYFILLGTLLRGLAASLINTPYTKPLVAFGTTLHDKYFLPHYLLEDFKKIINYLNGNGLSFRFEDYEPFYEFRFPLLADEKINDGNFRIRKALELWPIMAEQPVGMGATARLVDSSMERLQFEIESAENPILLVNGHSVPLVRENNKWIGGLRFKAYFCQPGLQPHIPPQSPLRIELIDGQENHLLLSALYHNWKPDGSDYDGLPQEKSEATARIRERFILQDTNKISGIPRFIPKEFRTDAFPLTLDLRQFVP